MLDLPGVAHLQKHTNQHLSLTLDLKSTLGVLKGHFPQQPVVPGIAQVTWAVHFARQHLDVTGGFQQLGNIKFSSVIMPPAKVELDLDWHAQKSRLSFCYTAADIERIHSSGLVHFQTGNADCAA